MKPPLYFETPIKSNKKLNPQQWDQQNLNLGYKSVPNEMTGGYKHYYNPNNYVMDEKGGFIKKSDVGNSNINYNNDPTYQPFIKYEAPGNNINSKKLSTDLDSGRKAFDFQYANQGYTGYKYDNGDIKYLNDKGEDLQNTNKQSSSLSQMNSGGLVKKIKGYFGGGDVDSAIGFGQQAGNILGESILAKNTRSDGTIDPNKGGLATSLKDAGTGAALGAQIGSVIPGVGTLIGAGVGLVGGGLYGALTGNKQARDQNGIIQKQLADQEKAKADAQRQFNFNKNLNTSFADRQAGYKDGGNIEGSGTAKSDSIKAKIEKGSFIVPAENSQVAQEIREKVLKAPSIKKANLNQKNGEEVKLSDGEHLFTPEEKEKIISLLGHEILESLAPNAEHGEEEMKNGGLTSEKAKIILKDGSVRGHALSDKQKRFFGFIAGGGNIKGYVDGGDVGDKIDPETLNKLYNRTHSKEKELSQKKEYQQELLNLKKQADTGNPIAKGIYMKRGAELSKYINDINKRYNINNEANSENKRILAPKVNNIPISKNKEVETQSNNPFSKDYAANENPNLTPPAINQNQPDAQSVLANKFSGVDPNLAIYDRDKAEREAETAPKSSAISDTGNYLSKGLGAIMDYGLPLLQTGLGLNYLRKTGPRPVDHIDQDYLNAIGTSQGIVQRANNAAKYGYTPEEQAAIDSQNNNFTEAQRYAARNLSGGSAANAYTLERNALNDSYGRGLQAKLGGRQLQLQKQSYADGKQTELNNLLSNKADRSRMLFGDTMNSFMQNQQAGGNLIGAGIQNLISGNRYQQELAANAKRNQMYNPQYPTTTI